MKQVGVKKPTFPSVIEQSDENMVVWLGLEHQLVAIQRERVDELVIRDKATLEQAVEIKRDARERKARILEAIKPYKVRLDEIKKQVLDVEKSLADEYAKVEEDVVQKINDHLDALKTARKKETERLVQLAERDREKRVTKVNKDLDALLEKVDGPQEKKALLEERLKNAESTEEEDTILTRIDAINSRLNLTTTRVENRQQKMQHLTTPVSVSVAAPGRDLGAELATTLEALGVPSSVRYSKA